MIEFRMPSLGSDMETGTILEWRIKPGDVVSRGDVVARVDTEKAEIEIEIWESGVVESLVVGVGQEVPVGTVIARLEEPGAPGVRPSVPPEDAGSPPSSPEAGRVRASPLARRLASERGLDLAGIEGSGPGGAIRKVDVERATVADERREPVSVSPASASAEPARRKPAAAPPPRRSDARDREVSMRRAIAAAMERSKREIPHYYLETTIDLGPARAWLEAENSGREVTRRLLPAVVLLKATARALAEVPELNGHWIDGAHRPSESVHAGMAVALRGGGLLAPAIRDVARRSLDDLMQALLDLVNRARRGTLRSSEISDATITVTSLGETGVEKVFGVIHPPQVALVGFGRIVERPWARDGMLGVRPVITATLAADHRASDGARGARFLRALADLLSRPEEL